MSTDVSIIDPACELGRISRDVAKAYVEYQDGERAIEVSEKKTEGLRERQRERRLYLGRKLIEAKRVTPRGGWMPFLEKQGIEARNATNWMREAGYVDGKSESSSAHDSDLNPRVAAGIDKRPRKRDEKPDPPEGPPVDVERPRPSLRIVPDEPAQSASWERDAGREFVSLEKKIAAHHGSWSEWSRDDITRKLQGLIDRIAGAT